MFHSFTHLLNQQLLSTNDAQGSVSGTGDLKSHLVIESLSSRTSLSKGRNRYMKRKF